MKEIICIYCEVKYKIKAEFYGLYSCDYCKKMTPTDFIENQAERQAYKVCLRNFPPVKNMLSTIRELRLIFIQGSVEAKSEEARATNGNPGESKEDNDK